MGLWSFYFITKFYWFERGYIHFDFILNFLFLGFLSLPLPKTLKNNRSFSIVKRFGSVVLAALLLWHDSWLPSIQRSILFILNEGIPLKEYLYRFLTGFVNIFEALILVLFFVLCYLANRKQIRLTPLVFVMLFIVPLTQFNPPKGKTDKILSSFFQTESGKIIRFEKPTNDPIGIDIVILHVCSLSWDDLKEIGLENDPFFKQFDLLFTQFNSVTSYSNPSAIRLLRGACGQLKHKALYQDVARECYLFDDFKSLGYETYTILNHDGVYGHFAQQAQKLGHVPPPILPSGLPIQAYNFDGTPIYDDYAVLEKWWNLRQASNIKKAALYYNTITLHDGAHLTGEKDWWKKDRKVQYKYSVETLLADFTKFIQLFRSSGRKGIILFVPEHGMALRGNRVQAAGLRDIPFPRITTVPVAVKLIGFERFPAGVHQEIISKPTSYLSLSYLLASLLVLDPGEITERSVQSVLNDIPETDYVSENEEALIVKNQGEFFLYGKEKQWMKLSSDLIN
ncbi:MAG: cellulose biosynthesis protein BcsG [Nitrospiria bacterium]